MSLALRAPPVFGTGLPLIAALAETVRSLVQAPTSVLELFPPILLAVPKSKVSHSRKSMRSANKGLKEKFSKLLVLLCCSALVVIKGATTDHSASTVLRLIFAQTL